MAKGNRKPREDAKKKHEERVKRIGQRMRTRNGKTLERERNMRSDRKRMARLHRDSFLGFAVGETPKWNGRRAAPRR